MARRQQSSPLPRLVAVVALLAALFGVMAAIGHLSPELGLDLRGGTSVVLTPVNKTGVTSAALQQAVDIIDQRVNGLGVSGSSVTRDGHNILISVPGKGRNSVLSLVGQTAQLDFREVYCPSPSATTGCYPQGEAAGVTTPTPKASATPSPSAKASRATSPSPSPTARKTGSAAPTAGASAAPRASATPSAAPSASPTQGAALAAGSGSTPPAAVQAAFTSLQCTKDKLRPTAFVDNPADWEAACAFDGSQKYILMPSVLSGTAVSGAVATLQSNTSGTGTNGQWVVDLNFKSRDQAKVDQITTALQGTNKPLAIVLDGVVQSAPVINQAFSATAEIQGGAGGFSSSYANSLANVLKYGALPLSFTDSQAESISASLGKSSLDAGLLAGALGLALVLIYCFIYYRALGLVTIVSLSVSAALVYAFVSLAGPAIGETLDLAGVAGLIVSIGITADSFVVFYERLKDEVREGRSVRSSVERGWVRARRTIVSADVVSLLAAVILYVVSIGDVRGFAFTLGLSTFLDLFVVFMFTKPLISLVVRLPLFSTSRASGLSPGHAGIAATTVPAGRS